MAAPTKSHTDHAPAAEAHHEHLSPWPLVLGVGALFTYLGAELAFWKGIPIIPAFGILVTIGAFAGWIREDAKMWSAGYQDPGVLPGKHPLSWWGVMFFLGTEVMLFGGLFAAFFVARGSFPDVWTTAREHLSHALPLVTLNTAILVSSGFVMHWGVLGIRKGNRTRLKIGLAGAFLLGATFLAIQVSEYASLIGAGITFTTAGTPGPTEQFASIFYLLTGTHGFHVFLGLVFIAIGFVRASAGQYDAERHESIEGFAIYWHFVDIVWLLLYLVVYVGVI